MNYASPAPTAAPTAAPTPQPANWLGNIIGNIGNSAQGGQDAPMYGGGQTPQGAPVPYATTAGVQNFGNALGTNILQPAHDTLQSGFDWINAHDPTAGLLSFLDSVDPTSPTYDPNKGRNLMNAVLIVGGIFVLVSLAPTINQLSSGRRD